MNLNRHTPFLDEIQAIEDYLQWPPDHPVAEVRGAIHGIDDRDPGSGTHEVAGDGEIGTGHASLDGHAMLGAEPVELAVDAMFSGDRDDRTPGQSFRGDTALLAQGVGPLEDADAGCADNFTSQAGDWIGGVDQADIDLPASDPRSDLA